MPLSTLPDALTSGAELLNRLPLGVSIYRLDDPDDALSFRLIYGNPASSEITGLDLASEVGRLLIEIAPDVEETGILDAYLEVVRTSEPRDLGTIEYGDDRIARSTYAVQAVPIDEGAVAVVFDDVSDRHEVLALREAQEKLAQQEDRSRTLLDALGDVIFVYPLRPDGPGSFIAFNAAAVSRYGYSADELREMSIADIIDTKRFDAGMAVEELRRERKGQFESVHRTRDDHRLYMSTSARLVEYDGQLCVVSLSRDDANRRQFRRDIARANRVLEDAVAERTGQLEAFSEDLKILHSITTADHASAEARYDAYLAAGCEMFDLPVGILAATPFDATTGKRLYRLEAIVSPDPSVQPGLTIPIQEAFCDAVVNSGATVAYADAADDVPDHPACTDRGFRAYIGSPVIVDGEMFGTLNFISPEPRPGGFTATERDLLEVMTQAVGRQISLDRAERSRIEAETLYRSVLESASEGIYGLDREGKTTFVNAAAVEMTGWTVPEQVGSHQHDLIHHHRPNGKPYPAADCLIYATLQDGKPRTCETEVFWRKDGSAFPVSYAVTPILEDGDVAGAVVLFRERLPEVLAAGDADRAVALLRSVMSATPDGVMAFTAVRQEGAVVDFEIILVNPRAGEILGRPPAGMIGHRLLDVFPGTVEAGLFAMYAGVADGDGPSSVVVPYDTDGLSGSFRVSVVPLPSEDGVIITFADVVEAELLDIDLEALADGPGPDDL
ncbi:PAS domain S-box protein [Rubrivirga sp. IMCC43871]|uniref:PAS domain S-box protein n=1 Tax=Rubrivirga sp. IMCC43871 TaxID=3391575 RepID=UPI00398FF412